MLSYGAKEALLTSVLLKHHVYVLLAIVPLICVIKYLHWIFANLF